MPDLKLTAEIVERAKPSGRLVEFLDTNPRARGLALRIMPSGAKSWTLRYRLPTGDRKRITFGNYPAVSLSQARDRALATLAAVANGSDPSELKRSAKANAERKRLETLDALAEMYFEAASKGKHRQGKAKPKRESTLKLERYYWERFVKLAFGKRPIYTIKRADIQTFVNAQRSPSTSRQIRVVFQRLFAFARWLELVEADPVRYVQVDAHSSRERVLSPAEMQALFAVMSNGAKIAALKIPRLRAIGIELCAVTLQRRGEVSGIDTCEIDLDAKTWTIPSNRTKNGRAQIVPLSNKAVALIKEAMNLRIIETAHRKGDPDPLFPTARGARKSVQPTTFTRAFIEIAKAAKVDDARLHDLRRTGAKSMTSERIGIPRFIVSRVLNHASDTGDAASVTAIYDRNAYLPEKRRALDAWAELLQGMTSTGLATLQVHSQ